MRDSMKGICLHRLWVWALCVKHMNASMFSPSEAPWCWWVQLDSQSIMAFENEQKKPQSRKLSVGVVGSKCASLNEALVGRKPKKVM